MARKKQQQSIVDWENSEWDNTGEEGSRYLPKAARDSLTPAQKAAGNAKKRKATAAGKTRAKYTEAERKAFLRATNRKRKNK